ncbi:hypothetical protein ACIGW8_17795 [Streptomyces sioyaensis]|uniref:hypothetical protein n=1 Tax=Streptomyces sioyaensis TaxID=67364 RepID=UPI0037D06216
MADKFDFPQDLVGAQAQLYKVRAELSALYKRLPWSVEPLPGWTQSKEAGRYYESKRPDSPGGLTRKRSRSTICARQMELVTHIFVHDFWVSCPDPVTARSALKHVPVPGAASTRDG